MTTILAVRMETGSYKVREGAGDEIMTGFASNGMALFIFSSVDRDDVDKDFLYASTTVVDWFNIFTFNSEGAKKPKNGVPRMGSKKYVAVFLNSDEQIVAMVTPTITSVVVTIINNKSLASLMKFASGIYATFGLMANKVKGAIDLLPESGTIAEGLWKGIKIDAESMIKGIVNKKHV